MELAKDPQQADDDQDCEPEDTTITPTADEIVSASLSSGALLAVCDIEIATRARDEEEACIQDFVVRGCGCVTLVQIGHTAVASFLLSTTGVLDPPLLS